jgi:competence protein ComGC
MRTIPNRNKAVDARQRACAATAQRVNAAPPPREWRAQADGGVAPPSPGGDEGVAATAERAFTRLELAALLAALALLAVLALPALANPRQRSQRVQCANNLRQIFVAGQLWAADHRDRVPWELTLAEGGTLAHPLAPNAWLHFAWLSNELASPVVLLCPSDSGTPARDFSGSPTGGYVHPNFANRATSYLVAHSRDGLPNGMMAGDRNLNYEALILSGCANFTTAFQISTSIQTGLAGWNTNLHNQAGNLVRLDGRVGQFTNPELRADIRSWPPNDNGFMHFVSPR